MLKQLEARGVSSSSCPRHTGRRFSVGHRPDTMTIARAKVSLAAVDAGVRTPADVQRILGVEQSAFVMDALYRQMELNPLETNKAVLKLTSLGQNALNAGHACK